MKNNQKKKKKETQKHTESSKTHIGCKSAKQYE